MSLTIEYAAIAQCTPLHIWQVFEQIERWPRWDPDAISNVRWVSGDPWTKGAKFSIQMQKPMSFKLTPEVMEVEAPIYVHLRGEGSGITGEQFYIFRWSQAAQNTEVRTLQEFSGAPIKLIGGKVRPALEAGIKHLLARVVAEAEDLALAEASSASASEPALATREPAHDPGESDQAPVGEPVPPSGDPPPPPAGDPAPPTRDPEPPAGDAPPPAGAPPRFRE